MGFLSGLISAGSTIIGGLLGKDSAKDAQQANYEAQKEFAQHGVRWKAEDAKAAGISPLYAMGAPVHSFTPSFVGDTSMPNAMASAGQDLSRAIDTTRSQPERLSAVGKTAQALSLQKMGLENELLSAQIAKIRQAGNPPALPMPQDQYALDGQGNSNVVTKPLERIASAHNHPFAEAAPVSDVGYSRTYTGGLAPVYSSDAKQRLEDDYLGMLAWNIRNRLVPSATLGYFGPRPPGHEGFYDPLLQEWVQW